MYLIVGLGNPDKQYEKTFHNIGFISVGDAAEQLGVKFKKKECESSVAEAYVGGEKVILARPLTYMNNSGRAVKQLMSKYKIPPENLLVIYDDYDLNKGFVRIRENGSAGTHNGMRNIIKELGTGEFARVRVGFHPEGESKIPLINYVLSGIKEEDKKIFEKVINAVGKIGESFANGCELQKIMQQYNGKIN